ncbi:DUF1800 domain-containing protein [Singulisphaera acidiphila]|uniref:DUF1800 domain-containing protein n=1 Tax=Singulisphaera acidiphila (strain ATCC BAA-1392 / DSM 18658 / VKM B-2454 / MOB10) TaxID=886293 RepID=L0DQL6_SINAD|nr:DUF1800 domain-containing protein [Singulisphaera acidiphila]AGA31248.1 Protein of unknown function (DUF1800) [Singulisphaera acidiphila DSM 18658]
MIIESDVLTTSSERALPWTPYVPNAEAPWNLARVAHLHRRTGFGASWDELQRDLKDSPEASIDRVLSCKACSGEIPEDFEATSTLLAEAAVTSNDPARLKAWWVYRMLFGPDPLGERLTLLWHDHFATSNLKVDNLEAMRQQNATFRRLARAPFGELLSAAVQAPALLTWLDAPANRKGHPNENLARELMELFTLGIGHFGEPDVQEAARALTGWAVNEDRFRVVANQHDDGEKTILGRTGRWSGDDLIGMLREHPATSERLARRLCGLFFGERAIEADAVSDLAASLRMHDLDVGWAVARIVRSNAFFAAANVQSQIAVPVEFVVGPIRALELLEPPPSTLVLADWSARLGQDLFYPPNVGGWPGGRSWLTTRSLIGRANYASALADGKGVGRPEPLDALALTERSGRGQGRDEVITHIAERLLGAEPSAKWHDRIASGLGPQSAWGPEPARRAVALILSCPEAQLA